jgi:large subunit ribosomal protein L22
MEAKAIARTLRVSPLKARLVANEVRGLSFPEAVDLLKAIPRKGAKLILKTVYSAGANAKVIKPDLNEKDLYIKKIAIDESIKLKRFQARARGRGTRIIKKTSHITVVLSDEN